MITRIVRLTLQPALADEFALLFVNHQEKIARFDGCIELSAFRDTAQPHVFFTVSKWQNEASLNNYRYSTFFKELWSQVKPMFAAPAEAHSTTLVA